MFEGCALTLFFCLGGALAAGGAGDLPAPVTAAAAEAPTGTARPVEFPGLRIFVAGKRIEADATFAVVDGSVSLEYLAVAQNGKVHESLLELACAPDKLQLGLILCGLEPVPEVTFQGEAIELKGPRVTVEVEWRAEGRSLRARAEDLVLDVRLGRTMERTGFAFTGSRFLEAFAPRRRDPGDADPGGAPRKKSEIFAATSSGSVIALYHDPDAILDNPLLSGGDVPLLMPTFRLVEVAGWVAGDDRLRPAPEKLPPSRTPAVVHLRAN